MEFLKKCCLWCKDNWEKPLLAALTLFLLMGAVWYALRWISPDEQHVRQMVVLEATGWLGYNETDGTHTAIVDLYNTYEPHPRDYIVTYEDNWCATFGSAAALSCGLEGLIPMECSCEQQILLFDRQGDWTEQDWYLPKTGDYIYYAWGEWRKGDCTAWANHVGIVVDTFGPVIKVIEGNKDDRVDYRYIFLNDIEIRGYGTPDYRKFTATMK